MTTTTPTILRVDLARTDIAGDPSITVHAVWSGVDRPDVGGYALPDTARGHRLAARLVAAMRAGVVYPNPVVKTDVDGQTYVSASATVLGRMMNADLKRLGF